MTKYFLVKDDSIIRGPIDLPTSWKNISGLHLLPAVDLALLGWLPQEVIGFEPFDPATQKRTSPVHTIIADKVKSTYIVIDKTPQEVDAEKENRANKLMKRGIAALAKGIADVQENKGSFIVASDMPAVSSRTKFYLKEDM